VFGGGAAVRLPWGAVRERVAFPESVHINVNNKPGAFVLEMLFAEFTVLAEKKIEQALDSQVDQQHCAFYGAINIENIHQLSPACQSGLSERYCRFSFISNILTRGVLAELLI